MTKVDVVIIGGRDHDKGPGQFYLKNIGRTLALVMFSRNRQLNEDSRFTVLG